MTISTKDLQINDTIKVKEIRVINDAGEQLGIMSTREALNRAADQGLDLVMIAPQSTPPVCRIMDYGRYRFERDKKEKEARRKQQTVELKIIRLSCRIDDNDINTKLKSALKFLGEGHKVKLDIRFRGREMSHIDIGRGVIMRFIESCAEYGTADKKPALDGRSMTVIISPNKTAAQPQKKEN